MFGTTGKIWALNFIFGYSLAQRNLDDLAVENFRKYLKIPSFQSNVNYSKFDLNDWLILKFGFWVHILKEEVKKVPSNCQKY